MRINSLKGTLPQKKKSVIDYSLATFILSGTKGCHFMGNNL